MRIFIFFIMLIIGFSANAQPVTYTVSNAHSHNDYENPNPFWAAYEEGFGSIEADIFLVDAILYVAHNTKELLSKRSLTGLYLEPLISRLVKYNGYPYADTTKQLQLLIDIKSSPINTLEALIELIRKNDLLINSHHVKWVISGNRPDPAAFITYPAFISFDGELDKEYSTEALSKISLLSDACSKYTSWNGKTTLSEIDLMKLQRGINKSHLLHKPVRFWGAPDTPDAWKQFMQLKVDYINTDHIQELAAYFLQK
jgi:alkaline phosphatase